MHVSTQSFIQTRCVHGVFDCVCVCVCVRARVCAQVCVYHAQCWILGYSMEKERQGPWHGADDGSSFISSPARQEFGLCCKTAGEQLLV